MAGFVFKLQAVLKQRQAIEDQKQRELAMVMRQRMILMDQLKREQQTITASKHALGQALVGRVDLSRVGDFARYSSQTTQRAMQIVNHLAGLESKVEQARKSLVEAMRNRKALDLLKEKHQRQWQQRQDRLEAAALDELAVQRHARAMLEREVD